MTGETAMGAHIHLFRGLGDVATSFGMDEAAARIPGAVVHNHVAAGTVAASIRKAYKPGDFVGLGGNSMGATAALDCAAMLAANGIRTNQLVLLDMHLPRALPMTVDRGVSMLSGKKILGVKGFYHPSSPKGYTGDFRRGIMSGIPSHVAFDDDPRAQQLLVDRLTPPKGTPTMKPFYMGIHKPLTAGDIAAICNEFEVPEYLLRAVIEIETNGHGSWSSGAVVARYEPHIAWDKAGSKRDALAAEGLAYPNWKRGYPKGQPYPLIDRCAAIAGEEVAALSTSWGIGQIMGFNHGACGYVTAFDMVKDFGNGEAVQLRAMLRFIKSKKILDALQREDWHTFAEVYNGANQEAHDYEGRLAKAAAVLKGKYGGIPSMPSNPGGVDLPAPSDPGSVALPDRPLTLDDFRSLDQSDLLKLLSRTSDATKLIAVILQERETAANAAQPVGPVLTNPTEGLTEMTKGFLQSSTIRWLIVAAVTTYAPALLPITSIFLPDAGTVDPANFDQIKVAIDQIVNGVTGVLSAFSMLMAAWGRANRNIVPLKGIL